MENIDYHILEAQEFMKNHKPAQALPHALKALELEPANEKAHFFAALAYYRLNQYEQAIIHFPQCMSILKTKPGSWEKHAESLSFLGRGDDAITIFRTIIDAHPGFMHVYHNFGYCLTCCQQYDEAIDYFNTAEDGDFKPAELYFYRGTCYFNLQCYEEARDDLEIFSKLKPEHVEGAFVFGELCFSEGNWQEAIDHYSRALFYNPQHPQALYKRLMSRLQIKDKKGLLINREAAQEDADKILLSDKPYFHLESKEGKPLSLIAIEVSETGKLNFGVLQ